MSRILLKVSDTEILRAALLSGCYHHTHLQKRNVRVFVSNLIKIIQANQQKRQTLNWFPFLKFWRWLEIHGFKFGLNSRSQLSELPGTHHLLSRSVYKDRPRFTPLSHAELTSGDRKRVRDQISWHSHCRVSNRLLLGPHASAPPLQVRHSLMEDDHSRQLDNESCILETASLRWYF